jgi:hypothetical protein
MQSVSLRSRNCSRLQRDSYPRGCGKTAGAGSEIIRRVWLLGKVTVWCRTRKHQTIRSASRVFLCLTWSMVRVRCLGQGTVRPVRAVTCRATVATMVIELRPVGALPVGSVSYRRTGQGRAGGRCQDLHREITYITGVELCLSTGHRSTLRSFISWIEPVSWALCEVCGSTAQTR